jgi:oligopeptide transport system substrate-binding protein
LNRRVALLLSGIFAVAGCARHDTPVETGARDGVLHFGNRDEPSDLDPHINNALSTGVILGSLFEGLVTFAGDGKTLLPGVAEKWDVSADGLTYTFHLRGNAKWSNGQPVTSRDFLDSFLRVLDPQVACENAGYLFPIRGARDFVEGRSADPASVGILAPDPRTLLLLLTHPAPYMLALLARDPFYPVYMPSLDANGGRRQRGGPWTRPGALVSNGPFILSEWRANAYVSVVRNAHFWDVGRIRLRGVRFYTIDDEDAEERAFRAGQLHVTTRIPKTKVPVYEASGGPELHLLPFLRTNYVTFNVDRAPFTDSRIRRAFSLAIDRERLVHAALGKLGTPAYSLVRPGTGGYTPPRVLRYDPREARSLLAAAGYPGGIGFPKVEFVLNGNTGVTVAVGEVLEGMWAKELGVQVTVVPVEFKVYLSTLREKQFQVILDSWAYIPDPHDMLELAGTGDPNNDCGSSNPAFDEAIAASERTADNGARRAAFDSAEAINAREAFYAPIYFMNQGILVHHTLHGWRDNGLDVVSWRELYLEP